MYIKLTLPWPPSVNRYWRSPPGKSPMISKEGRSYRAVVCGKVLEQKLQHIALDGRLAVHVNAYPPDRRARDLDNLLKALLDSLEHAGIYRSDSQIDRLSIHRQGVHNGGAVIVEVQQYETPGP